jgi:predicted Zn-dependent protease
MSDPRGDRSKLGLFLGLVYSLQGRVEDRQRVIEAAWERLNEAGDGASEQAILLVRLHIQVPTTGEIRTSIDQAGRSAPEDDRVWLGRARLAIRDGSLEEAARWLEACLRRRPDDPAVRRARLDWALAAGRLAEVRRALGDLAVEEVTPAEVRRMAARLAVLRGDLEAERRELERLAEIDPADPAVLDRLTAIAEAGGQSDRAESCRRRGTEIVRIRARYETLVRRNQTIRDAGELAGLADQLGRPFEAKVFRTIAAATALGRREPMMRPPQVPPAIHPPGRTLADELDAAGGARAR